MNSGDWVESLTALVESHEGKWEIITYSNWIIKEYENSRNIIGVTLNGSQPV